MKKYLLIVLIPIIIILSAVVFQNVKTGKIAPGFLTSYGSVILDWVPDGVNCYNRANDEIRLDYGSISSNSDFGKGYLTLRADDGGVSDIDCSYIDNQFIEVKLGSPSEKFENLGFVDYSLTEDESVTLEYHITVISGLTWTVDTEKSITIACTASGCDTTVGEGSCDFVRDLDFLNTNTVTCP